MAIYSYFKGAKLTIPANVGEYTSNTSLNTSNGTLKNIFVVTTVDGESDSFNIELNTNSRAILLAEDIPNYGANVSCVLAYSEPLTFKMKDIIKFKYNNASGTAKKVKIMYEIVRSSE